MSRNSHYLGVAVTVLAAMLSACSRSSNSPMGPSEVSESRLIKAVPEPACGQQLPKAPDTLYASVNSSNSISIMFEDLCHNEDGFWINYAKIDHRPESPRYGPRQQMHLDACDQDASGESWVSADITGLDSGFHYRVWVEAYNCAGSTRSAFALGDTQYREVKEEKKDDLLPPQAPDNLFASVNGTDQISIVFSDRSDNEDAFVVCYFLIDTRPTSPGFGPKQEMKLPAVAGSETLVAADIAGLEPGFTYRVWVEARNAAGSSKSNLALGVTKAEEDIPLITARGRVVYGATPAGA